MYIKNKKKHDRSWIHIFVKESRGYHRPIESFQNVPLTSSVPDSKPWLNPNTEPSEGRKTLLHSKGVTLEKEVKPEGEEESGIVRLVSEVS